MRYHIFQIILIGVLSFSGSLFSIDARPKIDELKDTFSINITKSQFDSGVTRWINKIKGKKISCTQSDCDTLSLHYSTGIFRTGLSIKTEDLGNDHLQVDLNHSYMHSIQRYALYRIPNVTYTLRQELGTPTDIGQAVDDKSYWAFLGLTLLNSGAGMIYSSYKSPFFQESPLDNILAALMDVSFTVGLFVPDKTIRRASLLCLSMTKATVSVNVIFIKQHNGYAKTKYKFILNKK